jgi:hypothetical protein
MRECKLLFKWICRISDYNYNQINSNYKIISVFFFKSFVLVCLSYKDNTYFQYTKKKLKNKCINILTGVEEVLKRC